MTASAAGLMLRVVQPDAAGGVEMMLAALVIFVCGLAVLLYFLTTRRSMPPLEPEQEREKYRYLKDHPNP